MMELSIYQIDAFASKTFEGNPAAVCPLNEWLPDNVLQSIAEENNLSETAYFIPISDGYHIRWFTPTSEVDLCGHATLASAYVIFNILNFNDKTIKFNSRSGILSVTKDGEQLIMDFPSQPPVPCEIPDQIINAFNVTPVECLKSEDYFVVFENEADVEKVQPDFEQLKNLDLRGVIITARSSKYDFVSRFFAPKLGVPEDPVTGSAHTQLTPYWTSKLRPGKLKARQVSSRGGELICELVNDRVKISGTAVKYLEGKINLKI